MTAIHEVCTGHAAQACGTGGDRLVAPNDVGPADVLCGLDCGGMQQQLPDAIVSATGHPVKAAFVVGRRTVSPGGHGEAAAWADIHCRDEVPGRGRGCIGKTPSVAEPMQHRRRIRTVPRVAQPGIVTDMATAPDAPLTARYCSLKGVPVFVTGGATGIGADIVRAFAAQGAKVGFVDIDVAAAQALVASLDDAPTRPLFTTGDVTRIEELRAAVGATAAAFGDIGVLVNNVANDDRHDFGSVDVAAFDKTVAVNLRPAFFAAQAVMPDMQRRGGGAIINVGSASWLMKSADLTVYATCKSAMTGLTRMLANELGRNRIRVNQVIPGWVMTDKQLRLWVDAEGEAAIERNQLLPGRLNGDDIARMILFLAADDSRMITAQSFIVDAGWV